MVVGEMEAARSSETSASKHQTRLRNNAENHELLYFTP